MSKFVNRRDLLKLAGGSALGVLLSPLPWKLVDDSAIWTQNWSLTPPLPRGRVRFRPSACTLCPANCPVRARCVGTAPVSLSGVSGHPFGDATLCPVGLAGHHMAFHPARIRQPWRRVRRGDEITWQPASGDEVIADAVRLVTAAGGSPRIGVLDRRPGRCASQLYRNFLARTGYGVYLTGPPGEDSTLRSIRRATTPDPGPLAYDLANAAVIVSFGVPLLEGWGSPAGTRKVFAVGQHPRLVQIGSRQSVTARRADMNLTIRPGTEAVAALGLGRMILEEQSRAGMSLPAAAGLDEYRAAAGRYTAEYVSRETGVDEGRLRELARTMTGAGPVMVIGGSDPAGGHPGSRAGESIAALNILIGAVNARGGIVPRALPAGIEADAVDEKQMFDLPAGSLDLLILDDAESGNAVPESALRGAVDPDRGLIIAFSPFLAGAALSADVVIPVPAPYESAAEVYAPPTGPQWAMGLAAPLLDSTSPPGGREIFLSSIMTILSPKSTGQASGSGAEQGETVDELVRRRLAAIAAAGGGQLFNPAGESLPAPADADGLRTAMLDGAWWVAEPEAPGRRRITARLSVPREPEGGIAGRPADPPAGGLLLLPVGWKGAVGRAAVPPLLSKLYQESDLRYPCGHASVNPATAREAGLGDAAAARIVTRLGSMEVTLHRDRRVMPGVIELACGPMTRRSGGMRDPLSLCETDADGSWDATGARLEAV
jgi:hypothetical protein